MKITVWFGRGIYTLIGFWYLLIGGIDLIEGKMRGLLLLLFVAFILFMIILSFRLIEKSRMSLVALTMLNVGFHINFAYSTLGEDFDLPIDRISSVMPSFVIIVISLLLFFLFWRQHNGEIERASSSDQ